MTREIKFRAWSDVGNKMFFASEEEDLWSFLRRIYGMKIMQFTGQKDDNEKELYESDVISFWLCYPTTQTHRGDNIPNGSYTEPDEPQLVKINAQIIFDDERGMWSYSIIGKPPYQLSSAFTFFGYEEVRPIIMREPYVREYVRDTLGGYKISDEDYNELLVELGFKDENDLMSQINRVEKIGSIYENPELLK